MKIEWLYCNTVLVNSGAMHNCVSAALVQAVKATTINAKPTCITLGNKFKVLSTKLAKLRISFTYGATQMVWSHVVPELSALVILGMDWLTQIKPKINWSKKPIEWTSNDTSVALKACGLGRMHDSVG